MQVSIKLEGMDKILKKLDPKIAEDILTFGLERLRDRFENRVGLEANQTVYSYKPKTNSYKRTGRLLGGRGKANAGGKPNSKRIDKFNILVEANPMLKGAKFNYAKAVNDGIGWMKKVGSRPFWTNSINWTNTRGRQQTYQEMKKKIEAINKK